MVEQNFLSPQVKRSEIISNKLVYNKLPQELPYDLRLYPTAFSPLGGAFVPTQEKKKKT